ncbi:MAG: hypothetical protein IJ829_05720, partial [Kiritimatiellae bacterium]|nr:hypothetical protein [Kiritimatiellia bacterium]
MTRRYVRCARAALSGLFFFSYGLVALPFGLLLCCPFAPRRAARLAIGAFYRLFVLCARLTGLFRVACAADDRAALRALRGRVVVMNHVSLVDVVILLAHLGDSVCIAKAAAKRNPFLSAVVRKVF